MILREWNWRTSSTEQQHSERIALIREITYEMTNLIGESEIMHPEHDGGRSGKALSLNISSGGMLLLMERAPRVERVVRVHVPTPVSTAKTPTLAEVRWVRQLPFDGDEPLWFVGMRFLF